MNKVCFRRLSQSFCALLLGLSGCASEGLRDVQLPPTPNLNPPKDEALSVAHREIFVDLQLKRDRCEDYDPATRRCGGGKHTALRRLNPAAETASAGDRVLVREGVIREQFAPRVSGAEGRPVTFMPYRGERVVFRDIDKPAWLLNGNYYLVLEGFYLERVIGWARLENAHYNEIRNNTFREALARGTTGGLKLVNSHYNRIEGNRFERGNDSLVLQASDRNLVADNRFEWARHSLLSLRCGNYNVIRGNQFHNQRQKAMEVYDCEAVSDAPYRLDATKRNLIEGNLFNHTRGSSRSYKYNAIQYAGQLGIVRHNLFRDNQGGGINLSVYADEALYNYGQRIYSNTFYDNRCFALISGSRGGSRVGGHAMLNNLFYKNLDCEGGDRQVELLWQGLDEERNALVEVDPGFVDEAGGDLRLRASSPWVDRGVFLTHTLAKGQGRRLPVADPAFFFDGGDVPGVTGDEIMLEGAPIRARVLEVDFATGSLLLDRELQWRQGQGVSLVYGGGAPDMGAYEIPISE
jgi:parallel beta-helix repeat protein